MKESRKVVINKKLSSPESVEMLADSINEIATAAKKLINSGLQPKAIHILIHHSFKSGKSPGVATIREVLEHATNLERNWGRK